MVRNRLVALVAVMALLVSACATSSSAPTPGSSQPAGSPAATQASNVKDGGTLVVGLPGDVVTADPALTSDGNTMYVANNVVQGLIGLKPGTISELVPVLAAQMPDVSPDGLTYTFKLRTGIKFHDGTDFNAQAVKFNYERQQNLPKQLQDSYDFYYGNVFGGWGTASNLASIDTPDDSTVVFHLTKPQSNFLISQTVISFGIQSPTALKAGDSDNPDPAKSPYFQGQGTGMVGTGPFKYKEWVPNDHVTIVKNPDYWDKANVAHLDSVTFKPYPDQTAELNALQSGDIDLAETISPTTVKVVKSDPTLQVIDRGQPCNSGQIGINQTHPPMDNKDIRMAIAYAVNKPAYVNAFYAGLAKVADNWMPVNVQYAKPLGLPTYDPEKAKQLIAQSGLSGDKLTIDFWYPTDVARPYMPDPKGLFEAISRDLEAVGFKVVPHTEGWRAGYVADAVAGKFAADILGWTCDWGGPDNFLQAWLFNFSNGKPNPQFAYNNPKVADLMNQALAATNADAAKQLWEQAQDMIAADMPTVPLVNSLPPGAAKAYVKGFVGAGNLTEPLDTVWLDK